MLKNILYQALHERSDAKTRCEDYSRGHGFRNLDHMLEYLVFEAPFGALVIIDEMPEDLQSVLARSFQFGVEALELSRYEDEHGERVYYFASTGFRVGPSLVACNGGDRSGEYSACRS